jgi:hypothetical protein
VEGGKQAPFPVVVGPLGVGKLSALLGFKWHFNEPTIPHPNATHRVSRLISAIRAFWAPKPNKTTPGARYWLRIGVIGSASLDEVLGGEVSPDWPLRVFIRVREAPIISCKIQVRSPLLPRIRALDTTDFLPVRPELAVGLQIDCTAEGWEVEPFSKYVTGYYDSSAILSNSFKDTSPFFLGRLGFDEVGNFSSRYRRAQATIVLIDNIAPVGNSRYEDNGSLILIRFPLFKHVSKQSDFPHGTSERLLVKFLASINSNSLYVRLRGREDCGAEEKAISNKLRVFDRLD